MIYVRCVKTSVCYLSSTKGVFFLNKAADVPSMSSLYKKTNRQLKSMICSSREKVSDVIKPLHSLLNLSLDDYVLRLWQDNPSLDEKQVRALAQTWKTTNDKERRAKTGLTS